MDFHHSRPCAGWLLPAVASVCALLLALPAEAQWKWRDKGGVVQYSDLPPPSGVADKDILQRPSASQRQVLAAAPAGSAASAPAAAPLLAPRASEPELEEKRRKAEQEQADKKKVEDQRVSAVKADNCSRARSALRSLDDGVRIARTNDKGEREILDDKQRAEESKRAREVIASECK